MINIIEKNKRLWMFYCTVLRVLGWVLLCMGGIGFVMLLLESFRTGGGVTFEGVLGVFKRSYHHFVNIGLVSLGFSQLVRYLRVNDNKMGPLLRYGDKIFYLYAIITVLQVGIWIWLSTGRMGSNTSVLQHQAHSFPHQVDYITMYTSDPADGLRWFIFFLPTLLYKGAKVLILVGLGKFLKQLIAIIEDSKQSSDIKTAV